MNIFKYTAKTRPLQSCFYHVLQWPMQPKKKTYNFFINCFHHLRSTSLEVCNLLIISVKLQLHDAIYRLRFYSNSLVYILSLSNSHNNVASIQKNWGDKSHRVIVALENVGSLILSPETILNDSLFKISRPGRQLTLLVTH